MKPTTDQIEAVVGDFGMLRFFPTGETERLAIMRLVRGMVGTVEELRWLRDAMINHVGEWRGPAELRGVYCAFGVMTGATFRPGGWKPTDGLWADSSTPGYTRQCRNSKFDEFKSRAVAGFLPTGGLPAGELVSASQMKSLPAEAEEIAENHRLLRKIEHVAHAGRAFKSIEPPTAEDRAASRRLLGNFG